MYYRFVRASDCVTSVERHLFRHDRIKICTFNLKHCWIFCLSILLSSSLCLGAVKVCVLCVRVSSLNLYRIQIIVGIIYIECISPLVGKHACYLVRDVGNLLFIGWSEVAAAWSWAFPAPSARSLTSAPICLHIVHMGSSTFDSFCFLVCEVSSVTPIAAAPFCGVCWCYGPRGLPLGRAELWKRYCQRHFMDWSS